MRRSYRPPQAFVEKYFVSNFVEKILISCMFVWGLGEKCFRLIRWPHGPTFKVSDVNEMGGEMFERARGKVSVLSIERAYRTPNPELIIFDYFLWPPV